MVSGAVRAVAGAGFPSAAAPTPRVALRVDFRACTEGTRATASTLARAATSNGHRALCTSAARARALVAAVCFRFTRMEYTGFAEWRRGWLNAHGVGTAVCDVHIFT